jgi:uncharacterized protein (TIGR00269 family)
LDPGRHAGKLQNCDLCNGPAVIRIREPERRFCGPHFEADLEQRVADTIAAQCMISPGDRVAVAFSGGKDSSALLSILHRLYSPFRDTSLVAITIDEGIEGYREETIRAARRLATRLGIEHSIHSFSSLFGDDLDHLLAGREKQACTVCGVLRRRGLAIAASGVGATKIATGHNLDDEAQSVLMNFLRGDLPRLVSDTTSHDAGCFLPRIKPLSGIPEKEIATYLLVQGCLPDLPECPYTRHALRAEVRTMLADLEYHHPGTMTRLIASRDQVRLVIRTNRNAPQIQTCRICGGACREEICQVCRILHPDVK